MAETPKPLEQAKPAPEKNDAVKAWETTEQFKKAQAARAATGEKQAKDLAKAPTLAQAKEAYKAEEIVVFGDSQIGGAKTNFEKGGQYFSQGGAKIEEVYNLLIANLDKVKNAKLIYIQAGGNDVWDSKTEKMIADIKKLTDKIKEANPGIKIVVGTIPPREETIATRYKDKSEKAAEVRQRLKDFNAYVRTNYTVFDVNKVMAAKENPDLQNPEYKRPGAPDVHFNKEGYIAYAAAFKQQFGINMAPAGEEAPASGLEKPEEKPGELHSKYLEKVEKIDEKETKADREKLFSSKLADIRYKHRLLKDPKADETPEEARSNLKEETTRRIRSLTRENDKEWYTIDYQKIYEMTLGLGDILLDPDIQNVLIEKDGHTILGHRGVIASKRFKGRVGFMDQNGNYIATYTGDKFRILKSNENPIGEYKKAIEEEQKARDAHRVVFEAGSKSMENYSAPYVSPEEIVRTFGKVDLSADLAEKANASSRRGTRVREFTDLESKNQPLAQVIRGVCISLGCPEALIYATYLHESGFSNSSVGDVTLPGKSVGIGQFRPGTWDMISRDPEYQAFVNQYYPGRKFDRGESVLSDVAASVVLLKRIAKRGNVDLKQPLSTANIIYLRGGYNAGNGEPYRKSYINGQGSRYMPFVYNYRNFEKGYNDLVHGQKADENFGKGVIGSSSKSTETIVATSAPTENGNGSIRLKADRDWNPLPERAGSFVRFIDVRPTNKQWVLGCSTICGGEKWANKTDTGVVGFGGGGAVAMLRDLPAYWKRLEKAGAKVPEQVIIAELPLNGLTNRHFDAYKQGKTIDPEKNARAELKVHLQIAAYLKSKGVKTVKISTTHVWDAKIKKTQTIDPSKDVVADTIAFNRLLQAEHPELTVDITPVAKSRGLHNTSDYQRIMKVYESAVA